MGACHVKRIRLMIGLVLIGSLLLLSGYGQDLNDRNRFYETIEPTDLSLENVKGVSLGSAEELVLTKFKSPSEVNEIPNTLTKYFVYKDVEFGIKGKIVYRYFLRGLYRTEKGISAGDGVDKVIDAYGSHYYERTDTGTDIIGYFDKKHSINMEFSFVDDKLIGTIIQKP
jgi:hypothetical protein